MKPNGRRRSSAWPVRWIRDGGVLARPDLLLRPWPWYVAGPLPGLFVPLLLILGNRQSGMSGSLRAICAALAPARGRIDFFRYDWRGTGLWNVAFGIGLLLGAVLTATVSGIPAPAISPATQTALAAEDP